MPFYLQLVLAFYNIKLHPSKNILNADIPEESDTRTKITADICHRITIKYYFWIDDHFIKLFRAFLCDIDSIKETASYEVNIQHTILLTKSCICTAFIELRAFFHRCTELFHSNISEMSPRLPLRVDLFQKACIFYETVLVAKTELASKSVIVVVRKYIGERLHDLKYFFKYDNSEVQDILTESFNESMEEYLKILIE